MSRIRPCPWMPEDVRYQLQFVLWVVLFGPFAYLSAMWKLLGSSASWRTLLSFYLLAASHFLFFGVVVGAAALFWRRNLDAWRRLSRLERAGIVAGLIVLTVGGTGMTLLLLGHGQGLLMHGLTDYMIVPVVALVERLNYKMLSNRLEAEELALAQERALRAAAEARWSSLESRLRPHFLFNTLSSIRELMHRDVAEASVMVQRFADLLRFSLDSERRSVVSLEEELRIVMDYLEIEQMRLGARLEWKVSVTPGCGAVAVPALSVLTLVENSLKHAIAPRRAGGTVSVSAAKNNENLLLEVRDDGPGFVEEDMVPGRGLDLLVRHLESWDGGRFEIVRGGLGALVRVTLPLRRTERLSTACAAGNGGVQA